MQLLIPASEEFVGFVLVLLTLLGEVCGDASEDLEKLVRNKILRRDLK